MAASKAGSKLIHELLVLHTGAGSPGTDMAASKAGSKLIHESLVLHTGAGSPGSVWRQRTYRAADNYTSVCHLYRKLITGGAGGEGGENALVKTFSWRFYVLFKSCP